MHAPLVAVFILFALALACDARVIKRFDPNHQPYRFVPAENSRHRNLRSPPATFTVIYNAGTPTNVKNAVDYVLNLLDSWIVFSSVAPIRVNFSWVDLGANVLGSAGSGWTTQSVNRPYPLYIALNNAYWTGSIDINAHFSSTTSWYLGTDGNVPFNDYDFPTVFMHEITHGLGLNSQYDADANPPTGIYNYNSPNAAFSSVFDNRLYYGTSATKLSTIAAGNTNPTGLQTATTSDNLFFRSVSGGDIRLFSPNPWQEGSSIAHLDPAYYGGNDSLMLPSLSNGDSFHYLGVPVLNILSTIGYTLKPAATTTTGTPAATTGTVAPATTGTTNPSPTTVPPTTASAATTTATTTTASPATTTATTASPATTSGQQTTGAPTQTLSAWDGTYAVDSSGCDKLTCCCLTGSAVVTYDSASFTVTINSPVNGSTCSGNSVELSFGVSSDFDQSGSLLWDGYTYTVSVSRVPSVLTVSTSAACGVSATCTSGACLAPLSASASLPTLSLFAALLVGAVMLIV